jgi:hypothetical protein
MRQHASLKPAIPVFRGNDLLTPFSHTFCIECFFLSTLNRPFQTTQDILNANNTPTIIAATNNLKWQELSDICSESLTHDPKSRPTFADLADSLKQLVDKYSTDVYKQEEAAGQRTFTCFEMQNKF